MQTELPVIPAKRYFTIGEVGELCGVKPHVLRYWEQEFSQLRPMKRRGNRRYYQHPEVLMIRRIRELLYEQGFTISGARNKLLEQGTEDKAQGRPAAAQEAFPFEATEFSGQGNQTVLHDTVHTVAGNDLRTELLEIRKLLDLTLKEAENKVRI